MDAIWSYKFLYKARQVHSYSEQHKHLQNFVTDRLTLERNWTNNVTETKYWNARMGPDIWHRNGRMGKSLVSLQLYYKTTDLLETSFNNNKN